MFTTINSYALPILLQFSNRDVYHREQWHTHYSHILGRRRNAIGRYRQLSIVMAVEWLNRYFSGSNPGPVPPLMPSGSEFALKVYYAALSIGYSHTATYAHIASLIGSPGAARAVGRALGANPIMIMIPCHRILGSDGSLTGFAAGLEVKRALLGLESGQRVLPRL